ncbi:MAG: hypothetical protein ACKN9J_03995 [Holophagaceae bacterium]
MSMLGQVVEKLPSLWTQVHFLKLQGESPEFLYGSISLLAVSGVTSVVVLVLSLLFLILVETTQVVIDDLGITVQHHFIPAGLSRYLGGGRLPWKQIVKLRRRFFLFQLHAEPDPETPHSLKVLQIHFVLVDYLEELITIIVNKSPRLTWTDGHD